MAGGNLIASAKEAAAIGQAALQEAKLSRSEAIRLKWYQHLLTLCTGVNGDAAALYRATVFMGRTEPLLRLIENNSELAVSFFRFQKYYEEFIRCQNNLVRQRAWPRRMFYYGPRIPSEIKPTGNWHCSISPAGRNFWPKVTRL